MAIRRSRRDLRRRRHQRRLPDRCIQPGRIPHQRQRHAFLLRRGRGATRQGTRGARTHPDAREDHHLRHGGPAQPRRSHVPVVRRSQGVGPRIRRCPPGGVGRRDRPSPGGGSHDPNLHVGNHGPAQGRDDLPGQHAVHDVDGATLLRRLPHRRAARFPALGPRRRSDVLHLHTHRVRFRRQSGGEPRDHQPRPAGGLAHDPLRGSAGLGKAVLHRADQAQGRYGPRPRRLSCSARHRRTSRGAPQGTPPGTVLPRRGLFLRRGTGPEEHPPALGHRRVPLAVDGRRAHRPGPHRLVLGARQTHVRTLRTDRVHGHCHGELEG